MAIDDATKRFLLEMSARSVKPLTESTPDEVRRAQASAGAPAGPDMHSVEDHRVPTADGSHFDIRVLIPPGTPRGIVVYFHGGGWVLGDIPGYDMLGREIAARTGTTVALVGYRLAPEDPYPAAVDDAWTALRWVADNRQEIVGADGPLFVAGDSAGGNLAIVTALRARTRGPRIAGAVLMYPVTDSDLDRPSYLDPENQLLLSKPAMEWFFGHYLNGEDPAIPEISPLRAASLAGFPPTAIGVAEHDPLKDEGLAFGTALAAAGVMVDSRVFIGQMHGFLAWPHILPAGRSALEWMARFVDMRSAEILDEEKEDSR